MDLEFGERMRVWRARAGLSTREATASTREVLPHTYWISHEKLRRIEVGAIDENDVNPVLLAAFATIYGCKVSDLSPLAAEGGKKLSDLLVQSLHCSMRSSTHSPQNALAVA